MGGDFDGNAGLRIPPHTGFSFGYRESPKSHDRNFLAFFQRSGYAPDKRVEGRFSLRFGKTDILCYFPNKITLVQRESPLSAPFPLYF